MPKKSEEFDRMVLVGNKNWDNFILEANTVEEVFANLSVVEGSRLPVDRHPEQRLKASFKIRVIEFDAMDLEWIREANERVTRVSVEENYYFDSIPIREGVD
ncbi:hypothetical protein LINGRAHAP2_LOCUS4045 [Linum grandiflorum]